MQKQKFFVVADVHGFYNEMMSALTSAGFDINNPDHIFVSLGDLMDRGPDPDKCLKFVNSIPAYRKILIRGNHEDLLETCLLRRKALSHDYSNGTADTIKILSGLSDDESSNNESSDHYYHYNFCDMCSEVLHNNIDYDEYMKSLVDCAEIGDYILVHGWIPVDDYSADPSSLSFGHPTEEWLANGSWRNGDWGAARWYNGCDKWDEGVRVPGKTIVCGHWHVCDYHKLYHHENVMRPWFINEYGKDDPNYESLMYEATKPFVDDGIVALDATTVCSHRVNCFVFEADADA